MAVIGTIVAAVAPYAAVAGSVASIAVGVKSANDQAKAQEQGARDAQRLAEMNAMAKERETAQSAANLSKAQQQEQAANRAKASASGVTAPGSFGIVQQDNAETNSEQLQWLKAAGASQAEMDRMAGQSAYNTGMANANASRAQIGNVVSGGINNIYGTASSAGWLSK